MEDPGSYYSVGWSHGKEKFFGKPDYGKGSFYANPLYDEVVNDEAMIKQFPAFLARNIWPTKWLPELEPALKNMGRLMVDVATLLAARCDRLVASEIPTYPANKLRDVIANSRTPKGRLLYYFPMDASTVAAKEKASREVVKDEEVSSWCGWHNDHGSLTSLAGEMFLDESGREVPCPDEVAGLYARSRQGQVYHVRVPKGVLAFQIGEAAQIHTAGVLQATPHSVRAASVAGVARAQFALFMEPEWDGMMDVPKGADAERVVRGARGAMLPPGVPALSGRWAPGQTFAEFSEATFKQYY